MVLQWQWGLSLDDVERLVWSRASEVFGDALIPILSEALAGYKRASGYDVMTRVYENTVGVQALMALKHALRLHRPCNEIEQREGYVELRSRLRSHLGNYLLHKIVLEEKGTPALRDALLQEILDCDLRLHLIGTCMLGG